MRNCRAFFPIVYHVLQHIILRMHPMRGHLAYLDRTLIYFPVRLRSCIRAAARHTWAKRAEKGMYSTCPRSRSGFLPPSWCGIFLFFNSFVRHRILCWQIFYPLLWRAKTHFPYPTLPKKISNFFHVVPDAHICVQPLHLRWWPNTPRASLASEIPLSLHNFRTSALAFVVALTPLSHTLNEARLQKRGKHMRYADTLSYSCEKRMQRKKR